jgi:hypothetical protein
MKRAAMIALVALSLIIGACASGPPRRVSEPAVNLQQLTVRADGSWSVDVRIDNFSSVPMRFDSLSFALTIGAQPAGTLQAAPALTIGPEAADVATLTLVPSSSARIVVADALARRGSVDYELKGRLAAAADKAGIRNYDVERKNALSTVPGLPGVMR